MEYENILAMYKPEDEEHPMFKDFLASLPAETQKLLASQGFIGSVEDCFEEDLKARVDRSYMLLRTPADAKLDVNYFSQDYDTKFEILDDALCVKIAVQKLTPNDNSNPIFVQRQKGTIEEMIKFYEHMADFTPEDLFCELKKDKGISQQFTHKSFLGKAGKTILEPAYLAIGLTTIDNGYVLKSTGRKGPYEGAIKKNNGH